MTVAYLANQFPSSLESYVVREILFLRRMGVKVIPFSAQRSTRDIDPEFRLIAAETTYLQALRITNVLKAFWLGARGVSLLRGLMVRILFQGRESLRVRVKAIAHTFLGIYFAALIEGTAVEHIHVHHGYYSAWIAMVAARVRGISYSLTLHGSDLLLHKVYLDAKLRNCKFCVTVSNFNRKAILENYPIDPGKVFVRQLGVDISQEGASESLSVPPLILAVGRLEEVKNHHFLITACAALKRRNLRFRCLLAGEGNQRAALESLIRDLELENEVALLGHISASQLNEFYSKSNLVVLTSRSEGLPVVLMEAMVREKLTLAPDITGIPELIEPGANGFLYKEGDLEDFVEKVQTILRLVLKSGKPSKKRREKRS